MLRPALKSFKVITESPVAVVLIFQCFKDQLLPEMREFFPMVLEQVGPLDTREYFNKRPCLT